MLKRHEFRAAHIVLLAIAINVLAVALWLALTSLFPIRVTPGFGVSHGIAAEVDWVGGLGPTILWLALFAVGGVLAVARMLIMRWVRRAPASADQPEVGRRTPWGSRRHLTHVIDGVAAQRTRPTLKS
jgi:hypothetical protein